MQSNRAIDLHPKRLTRTIVRLAGPAVVENLLVMAVFFADTLLIGWLHDDVALAAVGLGSTLMFVANGLFEALAVSAVAVVARACGEGDQVRAAHAAGQALLLAGVASAALLGLFFPLAPTFFRWLGAAPPVVEQGARYIRILLSTSLLSFPMMVANGAMRGAGDTRTPMWITLVMNAWNIVWAGLLIFGPGPFPALRLAGAGWATASARAIGGVLALGALFGGRTALRVPVSALWPPDRTLLFRLVRIALPNLGEAVVSRLGYTLFMRMVSSLGTVALAAHQIALRVESLSFMPGWGLSVAAATLAGQALGAGQEELAERSIRRTLLLATLLMASIGGAFALLGPQIVSIFGATAEVLTLAGTAVRIAAAEQPSIAVQMVLAGGLRGSGDTRTPMWVTLVGTICFRLAIVYLFVIVLRWGLPGVWWGTAADWAGRALLLWALFRRGRWKQLRV
ncbi:MAG: MATE family efflux transporter [Chloroflexia bacterium]